jgi:multimeric flavodoxin WrbA
MTKVVAINGSPRKERGNTAMILAPFSQGLEEAGAKVEVLYAAGLKIKPCTCGDMQCWYRSPGQCCIKDEMEVVYPKLRDADLLVLATPVYIPLPGEMQNLINRLCPLFEPLLEYRRGRTRGRFRKGVGIRKIVLVSTGGWWEKENFDTVERIVLEIAEDASVEFGGAVLRPHAFLMKKKEELTEDGKTVLNAVRRAGTELIAEGRMRGQTLDEISRPLISEEELRNAFNRAL